MFALLWKTSSRCAGLLWAIVSLRCLLLRGSCHLQARVSLLPPSPLAGPPGCGKSTLLKLLCGRLEAEQLQQAQQDSEEDSEVLQAPVDVESAGQRQPMKKAAARKPAGPVQVSGDICYNKRPLEDIQPRR